MRQVCSLGLSVLCLSVCGVSSAAAQSRCATEVAKEVFVTRQGRSDLVPRSNAEIRKRIKELRSEEEQGKVDDPGLHACITAELMRRIGDSQASAYYTKATTADGKNAEYHLLF